MKSIHDNKNTTEARRCQASSSKILVDIGKSGKKRPWREHKCRAISISEAYNLIDDLKKYASIIANCGSYLKFKSCPKGHYKRLAQASFCKARLCVMCQWRRSLVTYHQVFKLIHEHKKQYKSDIPILLTLTIPNVKGDKLGKCLNELQYSFKKFMQKTPIKRAVRSWFRSLEVTYSTKLDDYHPHYHVLLLVPEAYFRKDRNLYITQENWLLMWQESMGTDEVKIVDIRRVRDYRKQKHKGSGAMEAVSAEVAKYATKPADYIKKLISGKYEADRVVVETLHRALHGRRLIAFGGLFAKIKKELKLKDVEQADLVNVAEEEQECNCPICNSALLDELYKWSSWMMKYIAE